MHACCPIGAIHCFQTSYIYSIIITGSLKALLQHTHARRSGFQGQDKFPVSFSTGKVAEQRSLKTAFSYDLFIIIIISYSFSRRVFSELAL